MIKKSVLLLVMISLLYSVVAQNYENYTYKLQQSTNQLQFWTTTPSNKILKNTSVPQEVDDTIKVYCAKNEFEPFVIVIKSSANTSLTINCGNFGNGISTEINRVKYIYLEQATDVLGTTGDYPDPLVPIENQSSISVSANENTAIWFTVFVPKTCIGATNYTTTVTINGIAIPVRLHVFNFEVPEQLHVESQMNMNHNIILTKYGVTGTGTNYWNYVDGIKKYLIQHRLTPSSVLWSGGLTTNGASPYINYDCAGNWSDNDGIWGFVMPAERYLKGTGLLNNQFTTVFNNGVGFPSFMAATFMNNDPSQDQRPSEFCGTQRSGVWNLANATYNQKWFQYITSMQNYLNTNQLLNKAYYYFANEPQDQADYDAIAWYAKQLKTAAPDLKLMVSEEPKSEIYNNSTYPNAKIDIWLPVLNYYNPTVSWDREANHGEVSWIYFLHGTRPPYFNPITIDHQGVESKITGWFLWKYRIKGIAYYAINDWSSNPWTTPMSYGQNGNKFLFYPPSETNGNITYGSNNHRFVPSIRMELLRDGLEDYEYLYVLNNGQPVVNVQNSTDNQVNKIIGGLTSYCRDAEYIYNMRRLIGLKNGNEIAVIPNIVPPAGHWRSQGAPANYCINFQNPDGLPNTTSTETVLGQQYKYYLFNDTNYLQVGTNNYNQDLGYGWFAPNDVNWMMKYDQYFENGNELQKSQIYSDWGRKATFEFDIPSGKYDVCVGIGHRGTHNKQCVTVEGVVFYQNAVTSNSCLTKSLPVQVNDNKLTMEIGNGNDYTMLNFMKIIADSTQIGIEQINNPNIDLKCYPNPFSESTIFEFNTNGFSKIELAIYDVSGRIIFSKHKQYPAGIHQITFSPEKYFSNGLFICMFTVNNSTIYRKLVLHRN